MGESSINNIGSPVFNPRLIGELFTYGGIFFIPVLFVGIHRALVGRLSAGYALVVAWLVPPLCLYPYVWLCSMGTSEGIQVLLGLAAFTLSTLAFYWYLLIESVKFFRKGQKH